MCLSVLLVVCGCSSTALHTGTASHHVHTQTSIQPKVHRLQMTEYQSDADAHGTMAANACSSLHQEVPPTSHLQGGTGTRGSGKIDSCCLTLTSTHHETQSSPLPSWAHENDHCKGSSHLTFTPRSHVPVSTATANTTYPSPPDLET